MIGWIKGVLIEKHPPRLLLNVVGLGYEIEAPMTTFYDLPAVNESCTLHTHQVIREDSQHLYGFARRKERDVFRLLLKVNGVGAKLGLAILSGMDADALARCVFDGDTDSLSRLPGIGKKTAERLVIEMRDRLNRIDAPMDVKSGLPSNVVRMGSNPISEAISALVALGLKPLDASKRVRAVDAEGLNCEEIVRQALRSLVR